MEQMQCPKKNQSRTTTNKIPTDAVVGTPKSTTIVKVGIPVVEGAIAQIAGVALCAVVPVYEAGHLWDNSLVHMCGREGKNRKTPHAWNQTSHDWLHEGTIIWLIWLNDLYPECWWGISSILRSWEVAAQWAVKKASVSRLMELMNCRDGHEDLYSESSDFAWFMQLLNSSVTFENTIEMNKLICQQKKTHQLLLKTPWELIQESVKKRKWYLGSSHVPVLVTTKTNFRVFFAGFKRKPSFATIGGGWGTTQMMPYCLMRVSLLQLCERNVI